MNHTARNLQALDADLAGRLRFETLIAELSSRFVNLPVDAVDAEIEDAQRRVCECLGLELSALWQWSPDDPDTLIMTHLYRPLGGPEVPEPMDAPSFYPWVLQQITAGQAVVLSNTENAPPEAARDLEIWRYYGVRTLLALPLTYGDGKLVGVVSFNDMTHEREWTPDIVQRLELVAQVFTNALARKRADESLQESEERLQLAADSAGAALWSLRLADNHFWVTDRARTMFGFGPDDAVTLDGFLERVHPGDREAIHTAIRSAVDSLGETAIQYRARGADGEERWFVSRGRVHTRPTGEPDRMTGVTLDITERKQAEDRARDFSRRLIHAYEEERARLARELHDDITQRLARMAIDAGRIGGAKAAPSMNAVRSLQEDLARLSEDVHTLSYRLHPSLLADLGLAEALRAECELVSRQESIEVTLDVADDMEEPPHNVSLCLYRVAQEALRNVARHARATKAAVSLRSGEVVELCVRDDGVGFDPTEAAARRTLGLTGMDERVGLVNGVVDIDSTPGRGTVVCARVPAGGAG